MLTVYETDADISPTSWILVKDYIYRDGLLLAAENYTEGTTHHFMLDHLGTPRVLTDAQGFFVSTHSYFGFGEELTGAHVGVDTEKMVFTGHERDFNSNSGAGDDLDYMHARYCNPNTGRFLSVDPKVRREAVVSSQIWGRYSYAAGNPVKFVDPDGKEVFLATRVVNDPLAKLVSGSHSFIVVKPTGSNKMFLREGQEQIILGGYQGTRKGKSVLIKGVDAPSDSAALQDGSASQMPVQPADQTMEEFELNVLDSFFAYEDGSLIYNPLDSSGGKNSNALASGVLKAAGAGDALPKPSNVPGFNPGLGDPIELPSTTKQDEDRPSRNDPGTGP